MAQKFHFAILRIEVTRASRGLSAIAELLVSDGRINNPPTGGILLNKICMKLQQRNIYNILEYNNQQGKDMRLKQQRVRCALSR